MVAFRNRNSVGRRVASFPLFFRHTGVPPTGLRPFFALRFCCYWCTGKAVSREGCFAVLLSILLIFPFEIAFAQGLTEKTPELDSPVAPLTKGDATPLEELQDPNAPTTKEKKEKKEGNGDGDEEVLSSLLDEASWGEGEEKSLGKTSVEELKSSGFRFAHEQTPLLSSREVRLALTVGALVHGMGHFVLEEYGAASFLLGMEVVSALLIAGGILMVKSFPNRPAVEMVAASMTSLGLTGAVASWFYDIGGSMYSQGRRLGDRFGVLDGLNLGLGYRLVRSDHSPLSHLIDADVGYSSRWVSVEASTLQDVELAFQSYRLTLGLQLVRDRSRTSWFGVSAYSEYDRFTGLGAYQEVSFGGKIFGALDLGHLFTTLRGMVFGLEVGWDLHLPFLPTDQKRVLRAPLRHSYHVYVYGDYPVVEGLLLRLGYRREENVLLAPLPVPWGTFVGELRYRTQGLSEIALQIDVGDGVAIGLKGRMNFFDELTR